MRSLARTLLAGLLGVAVASWWAPGAPGSPASDERRGELMASLVIDLQVGFSDDTVVVLVDGAEVARREGVSTDFSIGRADSVRVDAAGGPVTVEVRVPSRDVSGRVTVDAGETPYVGVSIEDDEIEFRTSDEMFIYF